jgi:hypothetical protein
MPAGVFAAPQSGSPPQYLRASILDRSAPSLPQSRPHKRPSRAMTFFSGLIPRSKKQKFPVSTSKAPYNVYAECVSLSFCHLARLT